jgi:hypothetical protein
MELLTVLHVVYGAIQLNDPSTFVASNFKLRATFVDTTCSRDLPIVVCAGNLGMVAKKEDTLIPQIEWTVPGRRQRRVDYVHPRSIVISF